MRDWAEVVAAGLALPGVEQGSRYGRPALLFRGRMLAATTAPDPGSFVLHVPLPDKEVLIDTDPATFWETDHYRGWPAILVRYGTAATGRIAMANGRDARHTGINRLPLVCSRSISRRGGAPNRRAYSRLNCDALS
jgi:hypothetical protein